MTITDDRLTLARPRAARFTVSAALMALALLSAACSGPTRIKPGASVEAAASSATPGANAANATPVAPGQVPAETVALLQSIKAKDSGQLAISEEDGQFLRLLVASTGRKRALEIGSASGYSAIWIGMGLRDTGGRLVTIEYDPGRAKEAK